MVHYGIDDTLPSASFSKCLAPPLDELCPRRGHPGRDVGHQSERVGGAWAENGAEKAENRRDRWAGVP